MFLAAVLVVIGAQNWGRRRHGPCGPGRPAVWHEIRTDFRATSVLYSLVGLAGVYQAIFWPGIQQRWKGHSPAASRAYP